MYSSQSVKPLLTLRIIWAALNFSLIMYGFILVKFKPNFFIKIPETYTMLEVFALCMGLMFLVTLTLHEKKVKHEAELKKRFPFYVVCWALNESMAVIAFSAVFLSQTENVFIYAMNFILAITGNLIMFPKEHENQKNVSTI